MKIPVVDIILLAETAVRTFIRENHGYGTIQTATSSFSATARGRNEDDVKKQLNSLIRGYLEELDNQLITTNSNSIRHEINTTYTQL